MPARRHILALLVALTWLAACSRPPATGPAASKAVSDAYLAWWSARRAAYLTLDPAPLGREATAAALQADQQRMATLRAEDHLLRLEVDHDTQIVVYHGGTTASVDDVETDHSVELDPTTMTPIQPDPNLGVHESTTLHRAGGRWIVDGVHRFGVSELMAGQQVSWAAVAGGRALPASYTGPILDAYLKGAVPGAEHNERVAIEQDSVAWVYDTYAAGGKITPSATRLVQISGGWTLRPA